MSVPLDLKTLYRDGRLLPFIGAGVSASVEWEENGHLKRGPSWGELVTQAAKELGFEPAELLRARGTDLQILEYFKLKFSGHTQLTNWLLVNMRPPDDAIRDSPIHKELAAMTRCMTLYTTNFDDFLERSLKLHGRYPGGLTKPMWDTLKDQFIEETRSAGRAATARAVIAYCDGMRILTFVGERRGRIADQVRGNHKFYWDTIFMPDDPTGNASGRTYAEIVDDPKFGLDYKIEHLSQSSMAMKAFLEFRLLNGDAEIWR